MKNWNSFIRSVIVCSKCSDRKGVFCASFVPSSTLQKHSRATICVISKVIQKALLDVLLSKSFLFMHKLKFFEAINVTRELHWMISNKLTWIKWIAMTVGEG